METVRTPPPGVAEEKEMLTAFLEFHRATLALKCDGLTPEQLAERAVTPSALSLLGLVRHLADVERNWFRRRYEGLDPPYCFRTEANPKADFADAEPQGIVEAFSVWQAECEHGREIVAAHDLDDLAAWRRDGEGVSLRWIVVHLIEEYARHNGHADLLREHLDGATGV